MIEISEEEYNSLKTHNDYGLNFVDKSIITDSVAREVNKWFNNQLLLELNSHVTKGDNSFDEEFARRTRIIGLLNKKFVQEFSVKMK